MRNFLRVSLLLLCLLPFCTLNAQSTDPQPAIIINDEGGVVSINGSVTYTNLFFTSGVTQPMVILEDQAGFIDRNEAFLFPLASQTIGQITSDFYTSPFTYSIALPIEPQGSLRDVDLNGQQDTGVMVFAIAYWDNIWGDPFLEERDQGGGGWSTAYTSVRISEDPETIREVVGGKLLIYAPDANQGFPAGFGTDGLLFTDDDPIVAIPQGYTIVDLDSEPFTFDRSRHQTVDLIEPDTAALVDYSELSYTDAFDAMIRKFSKEYAFTEYKQINWEAIANKYRHRFVQADETNDQLMYLDTLSEIIWSIPDGHINISPFSYFQRAFLSRISKGVGMSIRETDDKKSYVTFVLPNAPADHANIRVGTEILAINDIPIEEYISRIRPYAETYSTAHNRRLGQQRYATRFEQNVLKVNITFQNEGDSDPTTVELSTIQEYDSFIHSISQESATSGYELPVEYTLLDSGHVYVKIYSFIDNRMLTIQLWERMIDTLNQNNAPGLIIDMRDNGGGNGFLADQMTAYFFDEPLSVGYRGIYSRDIDAFYFDTRSEQKLYLPSENLRYHGNIAVLVGPNCASACERFAYNLTLNDRASIVGHYPTAGLGGGVEDFMMPEGVTIRFTITRSVDANYEIHIEGKGVAPTLHIPVTKEALLSDQDIILQAAIDHLQTFP